MFTSDPCTDDQAELAVAAESIPVKWSLARTRSDLIAAFRLLYKSYVTAGLTAENCHETRVTPFHLLSSTEVFVAKLESEVISTVTMVADDELGLPMDEMYGNEIAALRKSGLYLAEMGCLASLRESPVRLTDIFQDLSRFVAQTARSRGMDALVVATHPRHAKFYVRSCGFEIVGGVKGCPYARGNPAVALLLDFERIRDTPFHHRLFGEQISSRILQPTPWDAEARDLLRRLYDRHQPSDAGSNLARVPA